MGKDNKQPFKYTIVCDKTKRIVCSQNTKPLLRDLQTFENTDNIKIKKLEQTKTCYIDIRYDARLRLWNYLNFTKKGLNIPKYLPFVGTEIGKSIPILNF